MTPHLVASTALVFALISVSANLSSETRGQGILFVTTSVAEWNSGENGTYLMELAVPFDYFVRRGFDVDIVSPQGGEIPLYYKGELSDQLDGIRKSEDFLRETSETLTPHEASASDYAAVIIPGGYGQFVDVHKNEGIARLITSIYENGGVIGTLGHGTAALVNLKLKNGEYLVKGKTMTSFPSWNEKNLMEDSNFGKLLPFDMEEELQLRGANLKIYDQEAKTNYQIVDADNRIVTASFATGGEFVANEVYKLVQSAKNASD